MNKSHTTIICRDIKGKKYKVLIRDLELRVSVYGIIIKNDKILLSKQWDGYDFPGGGIEKGETIEHALKREVWEETGLKINIGSVAAAYQDFFISIESKKKLHSTLQYYICKNPRGKISTKNFDGYEKTYLQAAEWVDLKDITKIRFYNGINSKQLINRVVKTHAP